MAVSDDSCDRLVADRVANPDVSWIQNVNKNIKQALAAEQKEELGNALRLAMIGLASSNSASTAADFLSLNVDRLMSKIQRRSCSLLGLPEPIFVTGSTPETYARDYAVSYEHLPILSFTSINSRLDAAVEMVKTLQNQDARFHSVNLYISPDPFLLDEGIEASNPTLGVLHDLGVNIYATHNIGPYRKQFPCIAQLKAAGAPDDTPIVTLDDDVLYPPTAISILLEYAAQHDGVVAHRGRQMVLDGEKFAPYGSFIVPTETESMLNLANGRNGILYRLRHFPQSGKDYVGPIVAPTSDDLWAKACTYSKCIPTVIIEPNAIFDTGLDYKEVSPERKVGLFHQYNARGTNDQAFENLECYFSQRLGVRLASLAN